MYGLKGHLPFSSFPKQELEGRTNSKISPLGSLAKTKATLQDILQDVPTPPWPEPRTLLGHV